MKSTLRLLIYIAALYFYTASSNAAELTIPFGLPEPPEARLAISDVFDSAGGDREEWVARFGTKASRSDIIAFYRQTLEEAGFEIYSSADQLDYAMIAAKRNDDRVTISFKSQSDWVETGENEVSINAKYNK